MGTIREVDAISDAIVATEKEIAGNAWGDEDTDALDESGDKSLEAIGEGLEGQHEAGDDDEAEGEESEGDDDTEAEGDGDEADGEAGKDGTIAPEVKQPLEHPAGKVPSGKYREVAERARLAEAERDALKARIEAATGDNKSLGDRLDLVMREIAELRRGPRTEPVKVAPLVEPEIDIFENPKGFVESLRQGFQQEIGKVLSTVRENSVATSFKLAHVQHRDTFPQAMEAVNRLNANNPDDRAIVQRIYNSPDPGEALVAWHRRNQTLAEVGDDPAAYRERIASETREALLKDPEFRKQLIADLRGEAAQGDNGRPRTETRLPRSLARTGGSNLGAERIDPRASDDSDQAVADAAWR